MILGVHAEVFLAGTYAVFLTAVSLLLELLAKRSHKRAEGYQNSGFVYFQGTDHWECPGGHRLVQLKLDHLTKTTVYRAQADACNSCSLKRNCTDSDEGRVLENRMDSWIESELRRFHRGISLTLLILATSLLLVEAFRFSEPHDRRALVLLLIAIAFVQLNMVPSPGLRAHT